MRKSAPSAPAMFTIGLAVLATTAACEGKKGEPRGLGPYRFGITTRAGLDMGNGICQPTELGDGRKATWCFSLPPIKIGKRVGEVDTYFLGTEPPPLPMSATKEQREAHKAAQKQLPLIELQLKVRGCVESEVESWMRQRYGAQDPSSKGVKAIWQNSHFWAVAFLPSEPGRCIIHFLPKTETAEIERLKNK